MNKLLYETMYLDDDFASSLERDLPIVLVIKPEDQRTIQTNDWSMAACKPPQPKKKGNLLYMANL